MEKSPIRRIKGTGQIGISEVIGSKGKDGIEDNIR
jgi:hypothetical protein